MKPILLKLLDSSSISASDFTHLLKIFGDGDMVKGARKLFDTGIGIGFVAGLASTGFCWLIHELTNKADANFGKTALEDDIRRKADQRKIYSFCVGDDI